MRAAGRCRPTSSRSSRIPFNVDTWNLAAISGITRRYTLGVHKSRREPERVWAYAAWAQDDWHPTSS